MKEVLLTSAYLAPVQYYTKLFAADCVTGERHDHYVKQTYRNRCVIAGPSGPLALTIPVEGSTSPHRATCDVRISDHGNWRHQHWTALVSAYESSPFFEFYADDLRPHYERRYDYLVDFNEALQRTMCDLLDLCPHIRLTERYVEAPAPGVADFRERIRPKLPYADDETFAPVPYYQVFAQRLGFLPNLSIVDLLFNMGPEARLVLRDGCR